MTPEELNKSVAEGLGWKLINSWWKPEGLCGTAEVNWSPSTNLQQAVDSIVPVLNEMGYEANMGYAINDRVVCVLIGNGSMEEPFGPRIWTMGQGSTPSERMAWALCEVFLKVKEKN